MLGDAEAVIDRSIAARRIQAGSSADILSRNAGNRRYIFRRILFAANEIEPFGEGGQVAPFLNEGFVEQAFGCNHMRHCIDQRDIGAGQQRQVICGLDMRGSHEVDHTGVCDDQLCPLAEASFHL